MRRWILLSGLITAVTLSAGVAAAADTVNAYSIWPENWARPMFQEFEKATGIKVNFVRFSSGEALARVIAEKNNPRVDVLFGGPVETHAAGIKEGIFESYKPPVFAALPARMKHTEGQWVAIADDPLVFMSNTKFLKEHGLKSPASWDDLLNPAYKNMIQMADARTSGTAVTRIFSILEVFGRDEDKAFAYMKKLRPNVQLYTKSGGGGVGPLAKFCRFAPSLLFRLGFAQELIASREAVAIPRGDRDRAEADFRVLHDYARLDDVAAELVPDDAGKGGEGGGHGGLAQHDEVQVAPAESAHPRPYLHPLRRGKLRLRQLGEAEHGQRPAVN